MRHYPGGGGLSGAHMLFGFLGFIGTLVVLGLLALLTYYLIKKSKGQTGPGRVGHHGHHRPPMPPALQILDERLARGEIEVEDYMTRKTALLGNADSAANEWTPPGPPPPRAEPPKPGAEDPSI